MRKPISYQTPTATELKYKNMIKRQQKEIDECKGDAWMRNQNVIDSYVQVFTWLNNQRWYQLHKYKVDNYVNSIIDISHLK